MAAPLAPLILFGIGILILAGDTPSPLQLFAPIGREIDQRLLTVPDKEKASSFEVIAQIKQPRVAVSEGYSVAPDILERFALDDMLTKYHLR